MDIGICLRKKMNLQDNSIPVVEYKKSSRSAREYMRLAEEVMELCQ